MTNRETSPSPSPPTTNLSDSSLGGDPATGPFSRSHTPPSPLSPPSQKEVAIYYAGLSSGPVLVARTGPIWNPPTGPGTFGVSKDLRVVGNHVLNEVWEDNLALKVHALLDLKMVKWTSTDIVRIASGEGREVYEPESPAPVILWIGVVPASLSGNDGVIVARDCRALLEEHGIADVDVEIRESVITRLAGPNHPKFVKPASFRDETADSRIPLTATLGHPICAEPTPWIEGTGGFFIGEGADSNRVLLVTARHAVLPPDNDCNDRFEHKTDTQQRHNVILFGDMAFRKFLVSIQSEIGRRAFKIQDHEECIESLRVEGRVDPEANREREYAHALLESTKREKDRLNTLSQDVLTNWATRESRILGHVIFSPPIDVGIGFEQYTEDFAIIEIDASKIDATNFLGNVIDLGTKFSRHDLTRMMLGDILSIHIENDHFKYPLDRLFRLSGTIPHEEMRHASMLDKYGNPCLMVLKRGSGSGLTIGRANSVCSYARIYHDDGSVRTSKEWAILPYDNRSDAFATEGDSGSVIVDGHGRIGGLLTSGARNQSDCDPDIAYATPISFLLKRIQSYGFNPNIEPVLID